MGKLSDKFNRPVPQNDSNKKCADPNSENEIQKRIDASKKIQGKDSDKNSDQTWGRWAR